MRDPIAWWVGERGAAVFEPAALARRVREEAGPFHVVRDAAGRVGLVTGGALESREPSGGAGLACLASLPVLGAEDLGDPGLRAAHGLRYAYLGGAMARGIGSVELVTTLARGGMLGFFGSAGLDVPQTADAVAAIRGALGESGAPWGVNLIHTPDDPTREEAMVDLFLQEGVRRVETSAFMGLSPAVVRYACTGLEPDGEGGARRRNFVFAKVSRAEVARHFLAPPPRAMLDGLVEAGSLTADEARLAGRLPVAAVLTVEADSGGHTDNRPLGPAFSSIFRLGRELAAEHELASPPPVGVAGGLGTPWSLASAFGLGASHVLVGSVHQACVESGTSDLVREMLAGAGVADVAMTSSADMFEQGIRVQVLKRGTMMPQRGNFLFDLYRRHASLEDLDPKARKNLEENVFRAPLDEVWRETRAFFERVDPAQVPLAERDPKRKMGMVFRWYLGKSSQWALQGDPDRRLDLQVWCGPAMGAFNEWTRGSHLADPSRRTAREVAGNLLEGAAAVTRAGQLRALGVPLSSEAFDVRPRELAGSSVG